MVIFLFGFRRGSDTFSLSNVSGPSTSWTSFRLFLGGVSVYFTDILVGLIYTISGYFASFS